MVAMESRKHGRPTGRAVHHFPSQRRVLSGEGKPINVLSGSTLLKERFEHEVRDIVGERPPDEEFHGEIE